MPFGSSKYSSDRRPRSLPLAPGRGRASRALGYARAALETARPYQWVKNALVFIPLAAAHQLTDGRLLAAAAQAFAAFTLCAASVYVFNDVIDASADRLHPHKRARPLACGRLPRHVGLMLVPLLAAGALATGASLDIRVDGILALYFLEMLWYTLRLRAVVLLDALALAVGYALRVAAGAFAVHVLPSSWLLAFCVFLFFSLALIKRYAELALLRRRDGAAAHARAYLLEDRELILGLGVSTGALAVLVLALYLSAAHAEARYHEAGFIWVVCVLLLYWVSHMWLMAHRGRMTDDPLVFALKNRVSRILVVLMGVAAWMAVW
ncbi:MAG TPA: UbiA family prenyltransferase [Steroidobacteraceae bacterium]|nr:UbiA family prenyltransferase [Steroidobacteraceae bacterium]